MGGVGRPRGGARARADRPRRVFVNEEHDFPRRIPYWMDGGALHARIEGKLRGKPAAEEWAWTKAR